MAQVEQLELGFAILDYRVRKAIIVCHTVKERDEIAKLLAKGFGVRFDSIALTKQLLEQIGTFDSVKRAQYAISRPDASTPVNITYADENLAARSLARDEENNPRSDRRQTFYRIPITNALLEEGVGATFARDFPASVCCPHCRLSSGSRRGSSCSTTCTTTSSFNSLDAGRCRDGKLFGWHRCGVTPVITPIWLRFVMRSLWPESRDIVQSQSLSGTVIHKPTRLRLRS